MTTQTMTSQEAVDNLEDVLDAVEAGDAVIIAGNEG